MLCHVCKARTFVAPFKLPYSFTWLNHIYCGCLPQSRFAQVRNSAVLWGGKWVISRHNYQLYLKPKCWLFQVSLKWWEGLTLMSGVSEHLLTLSWLRLLRKSHWCAFMLIPWSHGKFSRTGLCCTLCGVLQAPFRVWETWKEHDVFP